MTNPVWAGEAAPLNVYVLYDRTGSMRPKQDEAVGSTNAYVRALDPATIITVVAFDSFDEHQIIRDHVPVSKYIDIVVDEVEARGWTNLYDAVSKIAKGIFEDASPRSVLIIQTDGEENCSKRCDLASAERTIKKLSAVGCEVVFLGSEFKNVNLVSRRLGALHGRTKNRVAGSYYDTAVNLASQTHSYAVSGQSINLSDDEVK